MNSVFTRNGSTINPSMILKVIVYCPTCPYWLNFAAIKRITHQNIHTYFFDQAEAIYFKTSKVNFNALPSVAILKVKAKKWKNEKKYGYLFFYEMLIIIKNEFENFRNEFQWRELLDGYLRYEAYVTARLLTRFYYCDDIGIAVPSREDETYVH